MMLIYIRCVVLLYILLWIGFSIRVASSASLGGGVLIFVVGGIIFMLMLVGLRDIIRDARNRQGHSGSGTAHRDT